MAGKIPSAFIDDLIGRVDIVDVIDRRVPLTRKGKEFQACCPFHEEKTPSFTVSPVKQFYHCFGCGAHGTAIGFLMDYANLGFVEAVEELADGVGMPVPKEAGSAAQKPGDNPLQLLKVVEQASEWYQQQLRNHPQASLAVDYLKSRGLDGKIAASFGMGYAPDSWNDLALALGTSPEVQQQLVKAGLINARDAKSQGESHVPGFYDRFRSRIIFPIEDHRGRVVGFGGRILGDGEPKYLNSPETPLFHKGSELYGMHRARREIGNEKRSLVVEGYMDVVSLAQFGIDYSVATLGTATTRTHLQRLFRLAPEIVFCFDGDRAGRDAAWKALNVSLPEMQDGRQIGFLFLPDGEDPDTFIRSHGKEEFQMRVESSTPLPDFLFDHLIDQVDMSRMDGKARLVSMVKPLVAQMPEGVLREMMFARLSSLSGLSGNQLGEEEHQRQSPRPRRNRSKPMQAGQISPLALATSMLLQNPELAATLDSMEDVRSLKTQGADVLITLLQSSREDAGQSTARLLELFRESPYHSYLQKLAMRANLIAEDALESQFKDTISRLIKDQEAHRREELLEKQRSTGLEKAEIEELSGLLKARAHMLG